MIIRTKHLGLKSWEDFDKISYEKLPYVFEIIKAELTSKHPNNILISGSELKKLIDWSKILPSIIMIFESLQRSTEYLFLPIYKVAAIIHILLSLIDLQGCYKLVKVTINTFGFAEVIFAVIVCHHCFSGLVFTNSGSFFLPKTWYYYATSIAFYMPICGSTKKTNNNQRSICLSL